ncbi:MAG TPA: flagellar biosynthetic protein FliO [Aquamicrobium sp.]|nr:flagellar biosynthetic protein FliO [Aquamicrobium sp.]
MKAWLENLVGPDYAAALLWTIVALIVLLVLLIAIRIVRGFSIGTFVSGGRHRKTRLAVMDATAVDSHRRLVLVRRDDVEHLILIGGPTDVVVEQNIRMASPARRATVEAVVENGLAHRAPDAAFAPEPAYAPAPVREQPRPAASSRTRPVKVTTAPAPAAQPREPAAVQPPPTRPAPAQPAVQPMRPVVTPPTVVAPPPPPRVEAPARADLDDALLKELEVSLDKELPGSSAPRPATAPKVDVAGPAGETLDEEMSKLLRDLAGNSRQ